MMTENVVVRAVNYHYDLNPAGRFSAAIRFCYKNGFNPVRSITNELWAALIFVLCITGLVQRINMTSAVRLFNNKRIEFVIKLIFQLQFNSRGINKTFRKHTTSCNN